MLVHDMFKKEINREIKGVIKVAQDDEDTRVQELREYVVTRELLKRFSIFYQNYQKSIDGYTDEMGVWISGFFGSGKSHFLKILSYLLENQEVRGKKPIAFFKEKVSDPVVYADMERASRVECETILFNIDSKSPLGVKSDKEAILKVFLKVFYEHLGYYGDDFKVAELEKHLHREGFLDKFQAVFADIKGEPWVERRNCFLFDEDAIVQALVQTTGMSEASAHNWFNSKDPGISIGQFAQEVKAYIDSKGKNFHLIFLVDEIGQYIGDNSELMLNLQTVTEDLGTYCKGKAWVIVTSQEDIDSITDVRGNDFSKIQGRFKTRLSLSSASVDEVIQKRILEKKDNAKDKLRLIYSANSAALKNLIHFSAGTVADLKGYNSEEEFCATYPFVPYQFRLLQEVFNQIRRHGASGKHLSEGERSMLSAFQDAAKKLAGCEAGVLVPFYMFYDSVHEFLDGSIQRVIIRAEESAGRGEGLEPFDVNVLKLLFLIRYIGDIPANLDNIATLMITNMNIDKLALKDRIMQSLVHLNDQNYIQKNADEYRFLTDDEQDINREIKNTVVDSGQVVDAVGQYIFNEIYEDQKYQYSRRYPFPFNRKIDETTLGAQNARMGLRILTRAADDYDVDEAAIKMASSGSNDLIIRLDDSNDYFDELQEVLKIERFDINRQRESLPAGLKKIIAEKKEEAGIRRLRAKTMLEEALLKSDFYANGEKIEVGGSNARERIDNGFKVLVESVFFKLNYMTEFLDSDDDILGILNSAQEQFTLTGEASDPNYLARDEIMAYIDLQDARHLQLTMKNILDKFEADPYGWREIDIAGLTAYLFKKQKIRLYYQGSYLELSDKSIPAYLRKKTEVERLVIKKRAIVDEKLLKVAREICKELFNVIDLPANEDGLISRLLEEMKKSSLELENKYLSQYTGSKYPGKAMVEKGIGYFKELEQYRQDHTILLTKLQEVEDDLLDWDDDMKLVEGFFQNQRKIFDKGLDMLKRSTDNQAYLQEPDFIAKTQELQDIINDPSPYSQIIQIPDLVAWLEKRFNELLEEKKKSVQSAIKKDREYLHDALQAYGLSGQDRALLQVEVDGWYDEKDHYIEESSNFERLDAAIVQSSNYREKIIKKIDQAIKANIPKSETNGGGDQHINEPVLVEIDSRELIPADDLRTEQDVDNYLRALGKKLKEIIKADQIIKFRN